MTRIKRLSSQERKEEIMKSAAGFFKTKGFSQTTMEDVVSGTSLSKGGVYHYYKNTIDILHDLMVAGNNYRLQIVREAVSAHEDGKEVNFIAELLVDKMLDDNEFTPIYAIFLLEAQRNEKLAALFEQLKTESRASFYEFSDTVSQELLVRATDDFIIHWMNAMILGASSLGARPSFLANRDFLVEMVEEYLTRNQKEERR